MVIVAFGAHPDDVEFGAFGTLAKLRDKHDTYIVVMTSGEITGDAGERRLEANASGKLIDANVSVLDYCDGDIPVNGEIIDTARTYIDAKNPDIVFTHHLDDTHQDHRNTSHIVTAACPQVPLLLYYEVPSTKRFTPNYFYDVTDTFEVKRRAMRCHKTQAYKPWFDLDEVEGLARYRAYNCEKKSRLYEGFMLGKKVIK